MPVTIRNTDILFNDATTQSTAATVNTTTVLNATAGAAWGAVGSYAGVFALGNPTAIAWGATTPGSNLRFVNSASAIVSPGLGGTWRNMGGRADDTFNGVYLRIS